LSCISHFYRLGVYLNLLRLIYFYLIRVSSYYKADVHANDKTVREISELEEKFALSITGKTNVTYTP
jgi:hypothetical protein